LFITHDIDEAIFLSDRIYIMTGKPGKIRKEIRIQESRPRNKIFTVSKEFMDYKKQIVDILEGQ